ncbi:sigma-54 dependent transcriptional regulator [Dyadobacter sp. CY261]|uniref:sigma-54-dependent transcriptional regulator n=1 Tax=Dyadobacter sp. CY261 TaxID=2907203 RepID=UPI001F30DE99|nr:sigma-54 dependent transcriptional regulator [Dyadobacter sp. CY261]MCF0074238.1 sigma-54 dependent transcriptional regulator [Dyadobacter sp. CY261]
MKARILIVEDQFVEANNLEVILERAGYHVCTIARSVAAALQIIEKENPDLVFLDILLQGPETGLQLAQTLNELGIAFVYLSANSQKEYLDIAKSTNPYGFLVKPFRAKDLLVTLDVAWYMHQQKKQIESQRLALLQKPRPAPVPDESGGILGKSPQMLGLLDNIRIVSPSDTSVLILGESGTGKELVARAIHRNSKRKAKPFVVINCGALPPNLIESELFGHEKGAYTGAISRRVGKFEMADEGTLFLDEIGELPLDLQVKFLRVLQEMEIERVGGKTVKINVRIIAATNRNLEYELASGRFRLDLFYRLNVFPITLPPLRERKEDILILAESFLEKYALKEGKVITSFADHVKKAFLNYSWPGNVRELENIVARSVLLATGPVINTLPLPAPLERRPEELAQSRTKTVEENERDHIIAVLEKCNWKVYGPNGAAEILDMNVSTLNSRIRKLGIKKEGGDKG